MNADELENWLYFQDRETPRPPYCADRTDKEREAIRKQIEQLRLAETSSEEKRVD